MRLPERPTVRAGERHRAGDLQMRGAAGRGDVVRQKRHVSAVRRVGLLSADAGTRDRLRQRAGVHRVSDLFVHFVPVSRGALFGDGFESGYFFNRFSLLSQTMQTIAQSGTARGQNDVRTEFGH